EHFALKLHHTNQIIKNTHRLTSLLTYTPNKTSPPFPHLRQAIQNLPPIPPNNNQSLHHMPSTLPILSNTPIQRPQPATY
ncbi:hypothetical protein, partial [Staphylococcus epidermidis]|uniref:hypothetical protein n=1 Tax=Staphylococcus epidermidis TaxID=1282 RepID=UPI001C932EDD